LLQPRPKYSF